MCCFWDYLPGPQKEQRMAKFSVVSTHGWECHSQYLDHLFGVKLNGLGRPNSPTSIGSDFHKMKTVLGLIITVSDGTGQSVTVSMRGVD